MAMLAEPRQKKRYNLTPRGKALYEDETRFGTKMLEKMGWSKGKGLGANLHGSQDFVRVRMRNTNEGLGFEDRDDHWTQHEQEFNGLLKSLSSENDQGVNADGDKESTTDEEAPRVGFGFAPEPKKPKVEKLKDKISGISLEEKSKLSKARVHYRKFTKGKDIAQYSEKDLANIFGKKAVETEQTEGIYAELNAMMSNQGKEVNEIPVVVEAKEGKPNFAGVQTISTGLSVSDYFKQKMEAMRNKQKPIKSGGEEKNGNQVTAEMQEQDHMETKKKSKKRKRDKALLHTENEINGTNDVSVIEGLEINIKRNVEKRKKTKSLPENIELDNVTALTEANIQESEGLTESKKIKKKKKGSALKTVDMTQEEYDAAAEICTKKKSKNISGEQPNEEESSINSLATVSDVNEKPKKNKSKKKENEKSLETTDGVTLNNVDEIPASQLPNKKRKKDNLLQDDENIPVNQGPADIELITEISVKKNKKLKNKEKLQDTSIADLNAAAKVESPAQASSKKSKKQKKLEKEVTEGIAGHGAQTKQVPKSWGKAKKNKNSVTSI
ncbi:PIN2/TERF1-interacting telomerase inhibitor 1 isoform X2 [Rhagoletis pomonella]|uniref:PIN2/TERF1-interacting telomerase inhibitor 1 isoform X2 n=1 Tax=Rhagoletis pomonella TaxID=28610 RepID=UPI00177CDD90|nr:PIN2/TERF1-interacting telomerase inhibitor 1 isoform X2 [Rhagoletis pomonella]